MTRKIRRLALLTIAAVAIVNSPVDAKAGLFSRRTAKPRPHAAAAPVTACQGGSCQRASVTPQAAYGAAVTPAAITYYRATTATTVRYAVPVCQGGTCPRR